MHRSGLHTFLWIGIIAFMALIQSSCTGNNPKDVAARFLTSIARGDLDEAKKWSDSNTVELLNQAHYLNRVPDSVKEAGKQLKIYPKSVKEMEDKALVTYTTSRKEEPQVITLVKENDKWKVQLEKNQETEEEVMLNEAMRGKDEETPATEDTLRLTIKADSLNR